MHKLYEYACDELEELEKKAGEKGLSAAEVEYADKLTELKKNILKIEMLEDEGYSAEYRDDHGMSRARMSRDGRSYDRSYARGRVKRDSMGRYSRKGSIEDAMWSLGEMMGDIPEEARRDAEKLMKKLEEMM